MIRKVQDASDKVLKEVSCKFRKVLNKSANNIKNYMESIQICPKVFFSRKPALSRNHPTNHNANQMADYNTMRAQNQERFQNRPDYQ